MSKRNRNRAPVAQVVETVATDTNAVDVSVATATDAQVALDAIVNATDAPATDAPVVETVATDAPATDATANAVVAVNPALAIFDVIKRVDTVATDAHWSRHRETRAGIPIPRAMGLCARAWYLFDDLFAQGITGTSDIVEIGARDHGLNRGNLRTEISRYRKYHGIARAGTSKGITVAPVSIVAPVAPVAPDATDNAPDATAPATATE